MFCANLVPLLLQLHDLLFDFFHLRLHLRLTVLCCFNLLLNRRQFARRTLPSFLQRLQPVTVIIIIIIIIAIIIEIIFLSFMQNAPILSHITLEPKTTYYLCFIIYHIV